MPAVLMAACRAVERVEPTTLASGTGDGDALAAVRMAVSETGLIAGKRAVERNLTHGNAP